MLKYRPRLKIYKNSTGKVTFDPQTEKALSYNWWVFVKRINGYLVFNDTRYSNTTSKHQAEMRSLLVKLGLKVDLWLYDTRLSLAGIDENLLLKKAYEKLARYEIMCLVGRKKDEYESLFNYQLKHIEMIKKVFNVSLTDEEINDVMMNEMMEHFANKAERVSRPVNVVEREERKALTKEIKNTNVNETMETF